MFLPSKASRQECRLSQSCEMGRPCHVSKGEPDTPGWVECRSAESGSQQSGTNTQHLVRLFLLVRGVTASCGAAQVALGRTWKDLAFTHPSPVEIPPNPLSAQPSSIKPSYFSCYFCCPLVLFPGAGTFTLSSGLARLL